jgi:hypothetical protein
MAARIFITTGLLFALAAAWLLLAPADLPPLRTVKSSDDSWQLSQPTSIASDAALSEINRVGLWRSAAAPGATALVQDPPALTPPDWRIAGVFSQGDKPVALLIFDELPPRQQQLRVGDKLPGGAKILAITPDRVCILLGGKKRSLTIYRE